jgi:hypothetical protein
MAEERPKLAHDTRQRNEFTAKDAKGAKAKPTSELQRNTKENKLTAEAAENAERRIDLV